MRLKCIMVYLYRHLILAFLLVMKGDLLGTALSCLYTWDGDGRHHKRHQTQVSMGRCPPPSLCPCFLEVKHQNVLLNVRILTPAPPECFCRNNQVWNLVYTRIQCSRSIVVFSSKIGFVFVTSPLFFLTLCRPPPICSSPIMSHASLCSLGPSVLP